MATALGLADTQMCNERLYDLSPMSHVDIFQMQLTIGNCTPHSASHCFPTGDFHRSPGGLVIFVKWSPFSVFMIFPSPS